MFRLYLLALLVIIVAGLLLTGAYQVALVVPNPWIRQETNINGEERILICGIDITDTDRADFPNLGDWRNGGKHD